ncbi:uncharacterized protein LOC113500156 isoform X2 [Trichoplusia ni]|uniref:Uncharacterized protein LOC113500156 isoform X2 n=1 Tax=Trichoplusia ni TaxID=7111 RepID=A0A7E5W7Q0_TRINI|nr:uncharacterized protein LOC113500156 isoform X2 [Trichoplusia ni]
MLVILWLVVWASLISAVKHGTSTRTRGRGIFTTIKSQCIHRDFKYVDCNYCTCYAGYWVCTRRVCETEDVMELSNLKCGSCRNKSYLMHHMSYCQKCFGSNMSDKAIVHPIGKIVISV